MSNDEFINIFHFRSFYKNNNNCVSCESIKAKSTKDKIEILRLTKFFEKKMSFILNID